MHKDDTMSTTPKQDRHRVLLWFLVLGILIPATIAAYKALTL